MPNIGRCFCKAPKLWENEALHMLLGQEGWSRMEEDLKADGCHRCSIPAEQLLKALRAYVPKETLEKHYKKEFLENPEHYIGMRLLFDADVPDGVSTIDRYCYGIDMPLFASLTMPDTDICCTWAIDGTGDYGEFIVRDGEFRECREYNIYDEMMKDDLVVENGEDPVIPDPDCVRISSLDQDELPF